MLSSWPSWAKASLAFLLAFGCVQNLERNVSRLCIVCHDIISKDTTDQFVS